MLEEKDLQAIGQLILASEERLRTEFNTKIESEVRASEERLRTEFNSKMEMEIRASENRTHAYIESGVMKPIRLLAEGHAQILERLPEADELDSLRGRVRNLERIVTEQGREIDGLKRA